MPRDPGRRLARAADRLRRARRRHGPAGPQVRNDRIRLTARLARAGTRAGHGQTRTPCPRRPDGPCGGAAVNPAEPQKWRSRFSIRRGVYLLPSLFTLANLFFGFYAIILAFRGHYVAACMAIICSYVADILDGRIARLTGTTSEFGVEFDSLADLVSFCVAPALMLYLRWLHDIPKIGWVCAFVFVACGAIRLARFNAYDTTHDTAYFNGFSTPAAAGGAISLVFLEHRIFPGQTHVSVIVPWLCIVLSFLMVSNIRYPSFKNLKLEGRIPARLLIAIVFFVFIFVSKFYVAFAALFFVYLLSGLFVQLAFLKSVRDARRVQKEEMTTR